METGMESLNVEPIEADRPAALPHAVVNTTVEGDIAVTEKRADATPDLKQLLRELIRSSRRDQASVGRQIEYLPPDQLVLLADLEAREFRRRQKNGAKAVVGLLPVVMATTMLLTQFGSLPYEGTLILLSVSCLAMAVGLATYMPIAAHKILYDILTKTHDTRLIGPLLMMLLPDPVAGTSALIDLQDPSRRALSGALKVLLPSVRQDTILTKDQMQVLLSLLDRPYQDVPLTLAILKALEQIGDESAIPVVERLADEWRHNPKVTQAAQECLPSLQKRVEETKHARTLLRASSNGESVPTEMLLRPAVNATPDGPDQLLRPAG
jgi:hypothetical protein